jgi:cytochrome bd-type quinol oxidase subunit 2
MIPGVTNTTKSFQIPMRPRTARALSVGVVAALIGGYLGAAVHPAPAPAIDIGLAVLKLGGLVGAMVLFLSNYGQMSQRAERDLDEREVAVRNRAYVLTHQIMVITLFLAFFWVDMADRFGWWLPPVGEVGNLITAFALSSMALPAAILAWRDRPVAVDDLDA